MAVSTPWWLTFRCLSLQNRGLARSDGNLGLVKSAHYDTIWIPINNTSNVPGFLSNEIPCMKLAMVHQTEDTVLPAGVEVVPSLGNCRGASTRVEVVLSNFSNKCVKIQPSAVLCKLQQVELAGNTAELVQSSTL